MGLRGRARVHSAYLFEHFEARLGEILRAQTVG
jgi:hypothetical protein